MAENSADKDIVLLTGSSGYIGTALIRHLAGRYTLVGLDRPGPPDPAAPAHGIAVDMESEDSIADALQQVREQFGPRLASVIHLAAYYSFSGDPDPRYQTVNVVGTERLLRHLQKFEVEKFIFSSSMLVHSPTKPGKPIREDWPLAPAWDYPRSKRDAENIIQQEHGPIPYVILRMAGVYNDDGGLPALAQQIQRIYERQLIGRVFPGDSSHGQASLHIDDLVDLFGRLIEQRQKLPAESIFLVGEAEVPSYADLQREIGKLLYGEPWEVQEIPKALAKTGAWLQEAALPEAAEPFIKSWMIDIADAHYELDISKAQQVLGWEPQHRLLKTLPNVLDALRHDPPGWYEKNKLDYPGDTAQSAAPAQAEKEEKEKAKAPSKTEGVPGQKTSPTNKMPEGKCGEGRGGAAMQKEGSCGAAMAGHGEMTQESAASSADMRVSMHQKMLWPHYINLALGVWLLTSPFLLGYLSAYEPDANELRVIVERDLAAVAFRNLLMTWSDVISGVLVVIFSLLSLDSQRRFSWSQWANAGVGAWLLFAPLVFWTPLPEAYAHDTLLGAFIIAFAVLIPMMPGMSMAGMMGGPDIPPGWSYCPSTYLQRFPIAVLGFIGLLIARYLTAYQLGHLDTAWEPFFQEGQGTATIITSDTSKAWPIADAGVGGVAYMMEVLMAVMGDKRRWRTMPWMVLGFGILVVPLGGVSIFFIIIQPIVIGTWCTLCLIAALAMLIMIPYSLDELVATGQFLVDAKRRGKPFWRSFWRGDAMESGSEDETKGFSGSPTEIAREMTQGVPIPWPLAVSALIGIWLMFTRLVFDSSGDMANSDHLVGALIVTVAITTFAEVGRALRFINLAFGGWLLLAPWLLGGAGNGWAVANSVICGALVMALSLPRGVIRQRYGSWDRYIV
ncbi:MAG: vitamin K epoxide reductase family protein [Pseudomonadota bacterium]